MLWHRSCFYAVPLIMFLALSAFTSRGCLKSAQISYWSCTIDTSVWCHLICVGTWPACFSPHTSVEQHQHNEPIRISARSQKMFYTPDLEEAIRPFWALWDSASCVLSELAAARSEIVSSSCSFSFFFFFLLLLVNGGWNTAFWHPLSPKAEMAQNGLIATDSI